MSLDIHADKDGTKCMQVGPTIKLKVVKYFTFRHFIIPRIVIGKRKRP